MELSQHILSTFVVNKRDYIWLSSPALDRWTGWPHIIQTEETLHMQNVARQELAQLEGQKLWSRGQYIPRIANEMHHIC